MRKRSGEGSVPEYAIWKRIRQRCNDPNIHQWNNYGGRGIKICKRWNRFELFLNDVGSRPTSDHTIERIDNNGNYEPNNVKWATKKEQVRNRRMTLKVRYQNQLIPLAELAEKMKMPYSRLYARVRAGWSITKAVRTPVQIQRGKNNG